ncbi:hypothetical protein DPMN_190320 [Dreissena polymorpha]|uniref:Uncharacterized protein n=1 Tax=Dreissena polymorpha TaxID=45954 RepID=A0A9D4ID10_DREPO|nr:hypothetical protein DPMN_190320 [Dreissena polymorpha]
MGLSQRVASVIDAVITALERINDKSREAELNLADQWLKSNYVGWQRKKKKKNTL